MDDNFITQVREDPTRTGVLLDLICTNKEELVGDVKIKGSLGCSDNEMVEVVRILRGGRRVNSKLTIQAFGAAGFGVFKGLLGKVLWSKALEARRAQESC